MANRNRDAGHRYELNILGKLKELFPDILTSRNESRSLDAKKVDFCNTKEFNFQCKLSINQPNVRILDQMPSGKNVIVYGKVEKANTHFVKKGDYVIMKLSTFIELAELEKQLQKERVINLSYLEQTNDT